MKTSSSTQVLDLIERLSRISAAEHWIGDLNPAQLAALNYLAKANRYSRAPSQIAEFLSAMRGTVSGTLKALARKGLIEEIKSKTDRRRTNYNITSQGLAALKFETSIDSALNSLNKSQINQLEQNLKTLLKGILQARQDRSFGVCATCKHNRKDKHGSFCKLLEVKLTPHQITQVCFEHQTA